MYGHRYNIVVTNVCGKDLLAANDLASRAFIISSQANANKEDVGINSLFMTDYEGKPVRLTYTIQLGDGLVQGTENEEDIIKLAIDKNSICSDYVSGELYVNKGNIIDNNTLNVSVVSTENGPEERIVVNTKNLDKATNISMGIVKADEYTTYIDPEYPGEIIVNTQALDTVDDATNRDGIVRHNSEGYDGTDPRTIKAEDGRLSVITANLDKASASSCGVMKGDGNTLFIDNDGTTSVITANLEAATEYSLGVVRSDNKTIKNDEGILSVQTQELAHATMDSFGIIRPSQWCFDINSYDCLEVKHYADIERLIEENWPEHQEIWKDINDLKNRVSKLETTSVHEMIEVFESAGTLSTVLKYPERDDDGNIITYSDKRTIPFKIKTNCKFHAKVDWVNNENPQIKLLYVKYKDNITVNESELYNTIFEDTGNDVQTIEFTFEICNYNRDNNISGINTNAVISVASINNSAVKQTSHHTFTRWNNYAWIDEEKVTLPPPEPVEEPIETVDNTTVTRVFIENSETLAIDGLSTQTNDLLFNTTGSKKFYITGKVSYNDILNDGTIVASGYMPISLSTSADEYKIFIKSIELDENNNIISSSYFNSPSIISTYSTTGKNNVLNVSSKTPISTKVRKQKIAISFNETWATNALNGNTSIILNPNPKININLKERFINRYDNIIVEKIPTTVYYDSERVYSIDNGRRSTVTAATLVNNNINKIKYRRILEERVQEYLPIYDELDRAYKVNIKNPDITKQRKVELKEEFESKVIKLTDKFIGTVEKISTTINNSGSETGKVIVLEYIETPKFIEKSKVNVTADILAGAPYIKFTATRSKNSILTENNNWSVDITYRYINSTGLELNPETTEQPIITIEGNNTEYSKVFYIPPTEITKIMNWLKTNTVSSIVIKSIETHGFVSTNNYNVETSYSVTGSWPKSTLPEIPKEDIYTFGNAKIVSIGHLPWDDSELILSFTIKGGSTTNIPDGTQISEYLGSSVGRTNFVFTMSGNSYRANDIYWGSNAEANGYCKFGNYDDADRKFYPWTEEKGKVYWKNNQCTVYYKLYTNYQSQRGGSYTIERKFYLNSYGDQNYYHNLETVYLESRYNNNYNSNILNWEQRDYMCTNVPLLPEINSIRFWIGLVISNSPYYSNINVKDKFESSSNSLSDKIIVNFNFAISGIKGVSLENAATTVSR